MKIPSKDQFSRIFELISEFDHKRESALPEAIRALRDQGEPTEVVTYLRLNYSLAAAPEFELLPGERIADRYTIEGMIGAGGMGIVYRAKQDRTQRDVALKLVHPRLSTPELLGRFEEEIVTLGKLDHPGIVHIFDADKHGDSVFFTMQLVDGQPLHRYLREHTLSRHQKLDLIIRIADAVQAAHDRGIIHRDLKPANILIDNASGHPVILDFGLATLAGALLADDDQQITGLSGTPNYMSPEQFLGTAGEFGAGQSIDVYALGVIAFEILAGHSPYRFPEDSSWLDKRRVVLEDPPLPLAAEPELEGAVRKAIRKNPGDRYFTASGFAKALTRIQHELTSPEDRDQPSWKPAIGAIVPSTDWILEQMLGEGGIGQVWLARHPVLGERRVFKFCEDGEKVRSLKREASLFRLLKEKVGQHPNMVRLHDVSLDDPPYFLAMDHVEGGDLQSWAAAQGGIGKIPVERRIEIIIQAATTLQAAHDAGILHRDIKPSNLLIDTDGEAIKTYVADFGIGQLVSEEDLGNTRLGFTHTMLDQKTDSMAGSQRYMAPELLDGGAASVRSDVYSLGVVLYQMLAGDFNRSVTVDWYENIDDPLLEDDLRHCFSGDPEARFSSAQQLADKLSTLDERRQLEADRANEASLLERRAYRRGVARTAGIAGAVIAALAWLAWFSYQKYEEAWRNESRFRLAEVRALRETSVPERRQRILERIEEPRGNFPAEDIPAFRNEALAALAFPAPYGNRETVAGSIPTPAILSASAGWFAWAQDGAVSVAKMGADGLGEIQQPEFVPTVSAVAISADADGWISAALSEGGILSVATNDRAPQQIGEGCAAQGLATHHSGLIAAADTDGLIQMFRREDQGWKRSHVMGQKPPELTPDSSSETRPGPFTSSSEIMAFSPNGEFLATGGSDSLHVRIWDVESANIVALCRHTSYPTAIAWDTLDERRLWSASADGQISGWQVSDNPPADLSLQAQISREAGPTGVPIRAIDSSPDGIYLVCTTDDGGLTVLSRATLEIEEIRRDAGATRGGYLAEGGFWVLGSDGTLRLRHRDQSLARVWRLGSEAVLRLAMSPDGRLIAAACGRYVIISNLGFPAWFNPRKGLSRVNGVTFSATEPKIFAAGIKMQFAWAWDRSIDPPIFSKTKGDGNRAFGGLAVSIRSETGGRWVAFSSGTDLVARNAMGDDGDRSEWRCSAPEVINAITAGRDTPWIAVAREGGSATQLCFPDTREIQTHLPKPPAEVLALACPPDGSLLAQRTTEQIIVLDMSSGSVRATFELPLPAPDLRTNPFHCAPIAVSDGGKLIAASTLGSKIVIFDVGSNTPVAEIPLPPDSTPASMLFTSEGGLVVGTADGQLWNWDILAMRAELRRLGIDW